MSIRKRALDLLYVMCDKSNALEIVDALMQQVEEAEYQFKEELVLKVAILAEKFAKDLRWYIDTILKVIVVHLDYDLLMSCFAHSSSIKPVLSCQRTSGSVWFKLSQIMRCLACSFL